MAYPLGSKLLQPAKPSEFVTSDFEYKYRPLILTSNRIRKPQPLTTKTLNKEEREQIISAFKQELPIYSYCQTPETIIGKKEWKASDVVFSKILSNEYLTLVNVTLRKKLNVCGFPDGYENEQGEITCEFCNHYFLLQNNQSQYLGAGLAYIDHGDYNNDEQDDYMFYLSGYNRDGYVLFTNNFTTRVKYIWPYN